MANIEMNFSQSVSRQFLIKSNRVVYIGENEEYSEDFDEILETVVEKVTELDISQMRVKRWQISAISKFKQLTTLIMDNCNLK